MPLKVGGAAKYGMDVQVPGMVYAAVLQSPYPGGAPLEVDDARARKVPGVTDIVKLPEGVGVIGTTVEAARPQSDCSVTWGDATGAHLDSERALENRRHRPRQGPHGRPVREAPATPKRRWRAPSACSAANTARATSITRRWSR